MRTIPVDLILHSLADLLSELPAESAASSYADQIARCIRHDLLAEQWTSGAGVSTMASHLLRRLDPEWSEAVAKGIVSGETRAVEVAVARRLSDTAFAMLVEQDVEATARATTLLRAAQAIVGFAVEAPAKPEECGVTVSVHDDAIILTSPPPRRRADDHDRRDKALAMLGEVASALQSPGTANLVAHARSVFEAAKAREPSAEQLREVESIGRFFAVYSGPHAPPAGMPLGQAVRHVVHNLRESMESIRSECDERDKALGSIAEIMTKTLTSITGRLARGD